ncbi:MAG: sulfatase [Deltaproteobacteria bacterium]|nr:sulfatase [Deltaproteobacteria bacterium]
MAPLALGALVAVASMAAAWLWIGRPQTPDRPDIVFITIDTLRADRLGVYGYEPARTPNIDRLAQEGSLFEQATTPMPRTTPALASLLTGLWPHHHGSREVAQPVNKEVPTFAALLQDKGYTTLGASANGAASPHQNFDQGFDHFLDYRHLVPPVADVVTEKTLELLQHSRDGKPLFLWVHYIDPHFPYRPPAQWKDQPEAPNCRALMDELAHDRWKIGEVQRDRDGIASSALAECSALYDAEIAYTDAAVGNLLAGLEKAGRKQNTLVVFTADHGENLGEANLFYEHGPSVHDASLRVPLIFHGPGIPPQRDDQVFRLEDIMPTLLSLLRVPREEWPEMDGVDLSRRLGGGPWPRLAPQPTAVAESGSSLLPNTFNFPFSGRARSLHCYNSPRFSLCQDDASGPFLYEPSTDPQLRQDLSDQFPKAREALLKAQAAWPAEQVRERTLRTTRFKLVEYPLWRGGYRRALYDIREDPQQSRDVKHLFPKELQALSRQLSQWTSTLPTGAAQERSQEQIDALRALGYIQ